MLHLTHKTSDAPTLIPYYVHSVLYSFLHPFKSRSWNSLSPTQARPSLESLPLLIPALRTLSQTEPVALTGSLSSALLWSHRLAS